MRKILITGCSSGFGLLTALQFARGGDHVVATMRNAGKSGELTSAAERERLSIDEVAALIQAAVDAPTPRFRHVAGEDAKMISTAYKQMDFEAYEQAMRQSLDWHD